MKFPSRHLRQAALVAAILFSESQAQNTDQFNYHDTAGTDYGPKDWDRVSCNNLDECLGWPDAWKLGKGWALSQNQCKWCPATGNSCGAHYQSPLDLHRKVGHPGSGEHYECFDAHWIAYEEGGCDWQDMTNNPWVEEGNRHWNAFQIRRHALQIIYPVDEKTGLLQCQAQGRKFPRLDYPKGFPRWWHLNHVELTTPSEHYQHGVRYDVEVTLAHFYEYSDGPRHNDMGKVIIFMKAVEGQRRWRYMDKLICQWREREYKTREDCNLPTDDIPRYPGCRNGREPAPSPPPKPDFYDPYPWIDCSTIEAPWRICKVTSCCEENARFNNYCNGVYAKYRRQMGSICWHCCPGKLVDPQITPRPPTPRPPTTPVPTGPTTPVPTGSPTAPITSAPTSEIPETGLECGDFDVFYDRMCRIACVTGQRCASNDCHEFYETFGDKMAEACHKCCDPPREVAPAPAPYPGLEKLDCREVDNPHRICKPTSCCNEERNYNNYCTGLVYNPYDARGSNYMERLCYWCCETPKFVGPKRRGLRGTGYGNETSTIYLPSTDEDVDDRTSGIVEVVDDGAVPSAVDYYLPAGGDEAEEQGLLSTDIEPENGVSEHNEDRPYRSERDPMRYFHKLQLSEEDKRPHMSKEDFQEDIRAWDEQQALEDEEDDDEYDEYGSDHRRLVNYEQVRWSDYEWMRKVDTEYYFRYEGSQAVPPCYEKAHYRVMKDYIKLPPFQVEELQRLIAQRVAPPDQAVNACMPDTAGRREEGKVAVDVARPLQSSTWRHKITFCECKDWMSYREKDREWCEISNIDERFYRHPYNFDSDGF